MTFSHSVLSTMAGLVAYGSVRIITGDWQGTADVLSVPWDKFLGVGSGGLAFGVAWYFLQREERMRKAHDELTQKHLDTTSTISRTFAETTHNMVREVRDESEKREQRMLQMMQQRRNE